MGKKLGICTRKHKSNNGANDGGDVAIEITAAEIMAIETICKQV